MAQNEILYNFSSFETIKEKEIFVKNLIKKQFELSQISFIAYPNNHILHLHMHLMMNTYNSNFYKILSTRLNSPVSVMQFATIFFQVLDEQLQLVLVN